MDEVMKRCLFLLLVCILVCSNLYIVKAKDFSPPEIHSEGAVLMEANTGKILYDKNAKTPMAPASTTKVMTALLVLEKANLKDKVIIGKNPPNAEGTAIGIKEGEELTVEDLLYALLLESANDAAEALGEHIGKSKENFATMMNDRAKKLGCENTNFKNPSGLYEEGHVTTAYDLSLMLREVSKNPTFVKICQEPFYKIPPTNLTSEIRWVNNKNNLVLKGSKLFYKDCIAGKTGYTTLSRHTYTALAEREGEKLIVAFLDAPDKNTYFIDSKELFDYGFSRYKTVKLFSKGDEVSTYSISKDESVPLLASEDFYYVKDLNGLDEKSLEDSNTSVFLEDKDLSNVSFKKGDIILNSSIKLTGKNLGSLALTSGITREVSALKIAKNSVDIAIDKIKTSYVIGGTTLVIFGTTFIKRKMKKIKRRNKLKELGL